MKKSQRLRLRLRLKYIKELACDDKKREQFLKSISRRNPFDAASILVEVANEREGYTPTFSIDRIFRNWTESSEMDDRLMQVFQALTKKGYSWKEIADYIREEL